MKIWEKKSAAPTLEIKRLTQPFAVEGLNESDGTFSGKGMVYDSVHSTSSWQLGPEWKDRVRPGAFDETLAAHAAAGTKPLMLFMHERGNIPGVWTSIESKRGHLQLSGQVSKNAVTPSGVPLLELMKMGAITGLSIGFKPTKVSLDEAKKLRDIHTVELGEISIVDIPGSGSARITDVKRDIRGLEEGLRTLGLSKREAKALLAEGFGAIFKVDDAEDETKSKSDAAHKATKTAVGAFSKFEGSDNKKQAHYQAASAHRAAANAHRAAANEHHDAGRVAEGDAHDSAAFVHRQAADEHGKASEAHRDAEKGGQKDNPAGRAAAKEATAQAEERDQEAADAHAKATAKYNGSGDDDIPRDDHGRFATKSALDVAAELKNLSFESKSKLSDAAHAASKKALATVADLASKPGSKDSHYAAAKAHMAASHAHSDAADSYARGHKYAEADAHDSAAFVHAQAASHHGAASDAHRDASLMASDPSAAKRAAAKDKADAATSKARESDKAAEGAHAKATAKYAGSSDKHPDGISRDDHGRFATKSALDVAAELKNLMTHSGETPEQQARRDAAARSTLESIRDLANLFKE